MRKVQFILDEAAMLGNMSAIDDALGIGRGYGIELQFYFQSVGQLGKCFPKGQEQTLFSNTTQIFFGVNDNATAEYISAHIGEQTIVVDSGGTSQGKTWQHSQGQHSSHSFGTSTTSNRNWQQQARKLVKPEEVIALPPRTAITFTPGIPPLRTTLLRYYEETWLGRRDSGIKRLLSLTRLALWSAFLFGAALCLTLTLGYRGNTRINAPSIRNQPRLLQGVHHVGYRTETVRRD